MMKVDTKALKDNVKGVALKINNDRQAFKGDGRCLRSIERR